MEVIKFEEISEELTKKFANNRLIPVIGSGFTLGCNSLHGKVPSGESYKRYMLDAICENISFSDAEKEKLSNDPFSRIAGYYMSNVDDRKKYEYFLNNFSEVKIEDKGKLNFLKIGWPYIYTLNIDDGIEKNSKFSHVIVSNKSNVEEKNFDEFKCVIKLHGDVHDIIKYKEYNSLIFSEIQYGKSMEKNQVLLSKLNHDAQFQNLIFIGCSLSDEMDMLTSLPDTIETVETDRYVCVATLPNTLDKIHYQQYKITHIIVFDSYDDMYKQLYNSWTESQKICVDGLDTHKNYPVEKIDDHFETNKSYYLFGKSLFENGKMKQPFFFIGRDTTPKILNDSKNFRINIIRGSSYSGKTYLMCDLIMRIRNRDVYAFESKERITEQAFSTLLDKSNSVFLFDTNVLEMEQIEYVIRQRKRLESNNNVCFIFTHNNDGEFNGLISVLKDEEVISEHNIGSWELKNRFSKNEIELVNPLMTRCTIGILQQERTLLDNVIRISNDLKSKHKFSNASLSSDSMKKVASLIILAVEKKVYSTQIVKFDLLREIHDQYLKARPLIDCEETWPFESSASDNPNLKYVINAEYWLYTYLGDYANSEKNQEIIVNAFKYIIEKIVRVSGNPTIDGYVVNSYKKYILFDNINRIFKTNGRKSVSLIKKIYDGLNPYLSNDPNYLHQRAKCYIKLAFYIDDIGEKERLFKDSMRYANIAREIFNERFKKYQNSKIAISIAHVEYTLAIIACHECNLHEFDNIDENSDAILKLAGALDSPHNSYDYAKKDYINYDNVVAKTYREMMTNPSKLNDEARKDALNILFHKIGGKGAN